MGNIFSTSLPTSSNKYLAKKNSQRPMVVKVKSEYVTTANVEIDQRTTFEGAMKLFRREVNNSNVINEMKRRRYHEEAWMMRRRKEKERSMRAKASLNIMTFDDKNPLTDNSIFAPEYCANDVISSSSRNKRSVNSVKRNN